MSNLILTICSNHKREKGQAKQYDANARKVADILSPSMQQKLYEARDRAFNHITDSTREGKFPAGRPRNKELKRGPDIDPNSENRDGHYMPALKRYDGRFYKTFKDSVGDVDQCVRRLSNASKNHLLIVSGLYGLLTPTEPIQKYSCDVTDEPEINRIWRDGSLLTKLVISYIHESGITRIFDLMADETYRHLIDWESVDHESYGTVFYARCHNQTGADMLPELGHAAGRLFSEQPEPNWSDIAFNHPVAGITFGSDESEWIPGVASSKREKLVLWAIPMVKNIEVFLDKEGVHKDPRHYSVANRIVTFRNERNKNVSVAKDMKAVNDFRNKLVHKNHAPGKPEIQQVKNCYRKIVEWANRRGYQEPEDVDY